MEMRRTRPFSGKGPWAKRRATSKASSRLLARTTPAWAKRALTKGSREGWTARMGFFFPILRARREKRRGLPKCSR